MIFQTILVKSTCTAPLHDHHHFRYIRKIEYCAAYHLKRAIILPAQAIALVREPMPWQELPLVGLASLEITDEVENGVRIYTSKLTATLCKSFLHPKRSSAFRLTDVQGNQSLLGTDQSPYPLISQTESIGENAPSHTAFVITIQYKAENSLINIKA